MRIAIKSDCRYLRTKSSYIHGPHNQGQWREEKSMTAQYWCSRTMMPSGPDNDLVSPGTCQEDRTCFKHRSQV